MKIIHITASYKPAYIYGGPIMSVAKLCEGLVTSQEQSAQSAKTKVESEKFNLEVLTTTANGKSELEVEAGRPVIVDGVPVTYFYRWTKDHSHFSPRLLLRLRKMILEFKNPPPAPSKGGEKQRRLTGILSREGNGIIIHIHAWWNLVSLLSCLIAKWYKVPVVLSPRGMLTSYTQSNRNQFSKKIIHACLGKNLLKYCYIHATSEQEKRDIFKIISPKSIRVVPNLVDVERAVKLKAESLKTKAANTIFKLLFLSRIEEKKGLELLFDSLADIEFDYYLTIAGSGDESYVNSLKRKAESLEIDKKIKWIGQVGNDEKFSLMAAHDLLILPSYNENFANVVIESLSVGTAVLVSENVGLADYVKTNDLGWLCSLEPMNIAEKITEAYKDIAKREMIANIAPTLIQSDFSDETLVERYMKLYEEVFQAHPQQQV